MTNARPNYLFDIAPRGRRRQRANTMMHAPTHTAPSPTVHSSDRGTPVKAIGGVALGGVALGGVDVVAGVVSATGVVVGAAVTGV